jgi:hypothetical protein
VRLLLTPIMGCAVAIFIMVIGFILAVIFPPVGLSLLVIAFAIGVNVANSDNGGGSSVRLTKAERDSMDDGWGDGKSKDHKS